jgi:hypothetical protein
MAQHFADLGERCATTQHFGRGGVPQPMRADPGQTGPVTCGTHDPADRGPVQLPARCGHPHKHRPRLATRPTPQVRHQRLADIVGQRQLVVAAALAADEQQPATPVDVVEA